MIIYDHGSFMVDEHYIRIYPDSKEYKWYAAHTWEVIDEDEFYNNLTKDKWVKLTDPEDALKLLYCKKCKGRADILYMNTIPGEEIMQVQTNIPMLSCEDVDIKSILE
jgi:hypothetical protein